MAPLITMPVLKAAGVVGVLWWLSRKAQADDGGGGISIVVECDPDAELINPRAQKNCSGDPAGAEVDL